MSRQGAPQALGVLGLEDEVVAAGLRRVVAVGARDQRRAARPAPHQPGRRGDRVVPGRAPHPARECPEAGDVLAQAPHDEERAVAAPRRARQRATRGGADRVERMLRRGAEHDLSRPEQGLARAREAVRQRGRHALPRGHEVARPPRAAPPEARQGDAVAEAEVLVAGERPGKVVAGLDPQRPPAARTGEELLDLRVAEGGLVAGDGQDQVRLGCLGAAEAPALRAAGARVAVAEQARAGRQPLAEGLVVEGRHRRRADQPPQPGRREGHVAPGGDEFGRLLAAGIAQLAEAPVVVDHLAGGGDGRHQRRQPLPERGRARDAPEDQRLMVLAEPRDAVALDPAEAQHRLGHRAPSPPA
jgi:hypothetical protein